MSNEHEGWSDTRDHGLAAVLFDLDGTLVDSDLAHGMAYKMAFAEVGISISESDFEPLSGLHFLEVIDRLSNGKLNFDPLELHRSKTQHFQQISTRFIRPLPLLGLAQLLKGRVPMALVTSASDMTVEAVLSTLGIEGLFEVVISGDKTSKHKPDPGPYLEACRRLGLNPESCIAFEDSEVGVLSARRAGISVVGVRKPDSDLNR